jgi:hypothetical protein
MSKEFAMWKMLLASSAFGALLVGVAAAAATPAPDEAALLHALQDATHARVATLAGRLEALPDGPERRALEAEVVRVKRDSRIQFLRLAAELARERGDGVRAAEAERLLALLLEPKAAPAAETPLKAAPAPVN